MSSQTYFLKLAFSITGGNSLIIKLWGKNAAPPTHAIHFSFGVGALIVPQIARAFLPDKPDPRLSTTTLQPNISYSAGGAGNITIDSLTTEAPIEDPPIEYPYAIAGGITALVGLAELVIFFFRGDTLKDDASENKSGSRWEFLKLSNLTQIPNKGLHFAFILFLFIFWSLPIG